MSDDFAGLFGPHSYGPYGTNVGDIWSAEDSDVGKLCKERDGCILIHEVFDDGEKIYVVKEDNPDMQMQNLIRRAREGTIKWVKARSKLN